MVDVDKAPICTGIEAELKELVDETDFDFDKYMVIYVSVSLLCIGNRHGGPWSVSLIRAPSLAKDLPEVASLCCQIQMLWWPLVVILIHVSDLTEIEAETLLMQREKGLKLSWEEKNRLFEYLGTSPGMLVDFCTSRLSVDEFVTHCLIQTDRDLDAFPPYTR